MVITKMNAMKFYGRKTELEILERTFEQSKQTACFTVMIGRRRVGKTSLLLEAMKGRRFLYLFVSRKSEPLLCSQFQEEVERSLGLQIFGSITDFRTLFEQLMIYATREHYTLIIDEFQEFDNVNHSIFSDIQDLWDRYKEQAKINFIVCGSIYSMMKKIFENNKEPLFGRLTSKIVLSPFPTGTLKEILTDYNPDYTSEDLLGLYLITGGVAKYVTLLMEAGAVTRDKMLDVVISPDSPFLDEGHDLLVAEFGKEYGVYFSILQLIASGKTTQSKIDSIIEKSTGAYLVNLEKEYSLIKKKRPMFSKPESRKVRWVLNDNYMLFWFRFIYPNQSMLELKKFQLLKEYILDNYEQFSGLILERYFQEKMSETEDITDIGNYWDKKGENEIDIIALNHLRKTAIVAEVKRNPQKIDLNALSRKAEVLTKYLGKYKVGLCGFSLEDM